MQVVFGLRQSRSEISELLYPWLTISITCISRWVIVSSGDWTFFPRGSHQAGTIEAQVTRADGYYKFDLNFADPACALELPPQELPTPASELGAQAAALLPALARRRADDRLAQGSARPAPARQ